MKKIYLMPFMILAGVLNLTGCGMKETKMETVQKTEAVTPVTEEKKETISEEKAKTIALEDAGVAEADVQGLLLSMNQDSGRKEYDVEFYAGNKEYDYEIDIYTGNINEKDSDIENDFIVEEQLTSSETINKDEAISMALERVEGAEEQDVYVELDGDNGLLKYEGEVFYNGKEYEFEMDARTGEFYEWSESFVK